MRDELASKYSFEFGNWKFSLFIRKISFLYHTSHGAEQNNQNQWNEGKLKKKLKREQAHQNIAFSLKEVNH